MSTALDRLLATQPVTPEAIDGFLHGRTFPLIEGSRVTFAYRGQADAVRLRHFIYGLPTAQPFHRVDGTDFWYFSLDLPRGSRIEYKLEVQRGEHNEWIRDPLNPHLAHDPFGANSVCQADGYERPAWTHPQDDTRTGSYEERVLRNTALSGARRVTVYLPARYRKSRRYPLLVVHDGGDYLHYANLGVVLDNTIHELAVAPLIVALTHPKNRFEEYPNNEAHCRYIVKDLMPLLEQHYPILPDARYRGIMGASFGAVASLATAWHHPGVFGRLLLQSGSFAFTDIGHHNRGPAFDRVVEFVNAFREQPGKPSDKVYVSCGRYESLIYENRSMIPVLQAAGMNVRYEEAADGHNWENWRDRLRHALSWLFPGPMWMVYE